VDRANPTSEGAMPSPSDLDFEMPEIDLTFPEIDLDPKSLEIEFNLASLVALMGLD
jgi:hypothetical protein